MEKIKNKINELLVKLKEFADFKWKYDKSFFIKTGIIAVAFIIAVGLVVFDGDNKNSDKYQIEQGQTVSDNSGRPGNITDGNSNGDVSGNIGNEEADEDYSYYIALSTSDSSIEMIFVDVSGAVNKPGVVEIPEGSRVFQAIDMAGGLREDADTMNINLAAVLHDGDKLLVPTIETGGYSSNFNSDGVIGGGIVTAQVNAISASEGYLAASAGNYSSDITNGNGLINLNTASSAELESLSGIGPSTASKIIAYREEHGGFDTVSELLNVNGIGEKTLSKFEDKLCI